MAGASALLTRGAGKKCKLHFYTWPNLYSNLFTDDDTHNTHSGLEYCKLMQPGGLLSKGQPLFLLI